MSYRDQQILLPRGTLEECMAYHPRYVGQLVLCLDRPMMLVATSPLKLGGWKEIPIPDGDAAQSFRDFYGRHSGTITWP